NRAAYARRLDAETQVDLAGEAAERRDEQVVSGCASGRDDARRGCKRERVIGGGERVDEGRIDEIAVAVTVVVRLIAGRIERDGADVLLRRCPLERPTRAVVLPRERAGRCVLDVLPTAARPLIVEYLRQPVAGSLQTAGLIIAAVERG